MPRAPKPRPYNSPDWLALARTDPNWYASARNSPEWVTLNPITLDTLVGHLGRCEKKEDEVRVAAGVKLSVEINLSLYKSQILNRPTSASQISSLAPLQKAACALVKELCRLSQDYYTRVTLYPFQGPGEPIAEGPDPLTPDLKAAERIYERVSDTIKNLKSQTSRGRRKEEELRLIMRYLKFSFNEYNQSKKHVNKRLHAFIAAALVAAKIPPPKPGSTEFYRKLKAVAR